jgi:NodT family efflux transporter outer membrane factor (OMF) lipoprotein
MTVPMTIRRQAYTPIRGAVLAAALVSGLSACSLGPHYHRPDIPAPAAWRNAEAGATEPAETVAPDWWRGFGSERLNQLVSSARSANDDLAAAVARVREADAQARIAGAPLLPQVSASFQATRARSPSSSGGFATGNDFNPLLSASYALDFWGKNRAAAEAAKELANASRFDRATVDLTIVTGVANTYFTALELRDRLKIAQSNLDTAKSVLNGLQTDAQVGTANALDVAQQATVVATLDAAVPPLQQQLAQTIDALAILAGSEPESLDVDSGALADLSLPTVGPGLPSKLLARRPDVAGAEAQLIAANADIAQARAAFFPTISLTAGGGYESGALSNLFNPANRVFSLGGGLTQPIFEGGALRGQSDYAKARYAELLADYHKAVISAFGNVEDALTALRQTAEQENREREAVAAARRAYDFAQKQLHAGTINVLTLLNTESALFSAQDALAQVQLAHLQALVGLYNALGGGWNQES